MSFQSPLVSVVVPSYNHGRYIGQRIESIFAQTYLNFNVLVIDDCSTDNSDEVIRDLKNKYSFEYIRNPKNSGTPFSAWLKIAQVAKGDFIWICESDDFAMPTFLETAISAFERDTQAVLYYCNSWVVDENGTRVDNTSTYFRDTWRDDRWLENFSAAGGQELRNFQMRGQIVPNMSSALIKAWVFRQAFKPFVKRLRLTGDWLFIGEVLRFGRVIFHVAELSNFRRHEITSRVRVKSARSQAEFIVTKYQLYRLARKPIRHLAQHLSNDAVRFLHEPASGSKVIGQMVAISMWMTVKITVAMAVSLLFHRSYIKKFRKRRSEIRRAHGGSQNG